MPIGAHAAEHWQLCPATAVADADSIADPICLPLANLGALTYAGRQPLFGPASTTCGRSEEVILREALLYHAMASTTIPAADSWSSATGAMSPAKRGRDTEGVVGRLPLDPRGPSPLGV